MINTRQKTAVWKKFLKIFSCQNRNHFVLHKINDTEISCAFDKAGTFMTIKMKIRTLLTNERPVSACDVILISHIRQRAKNIIRILNQHSVFMCVFHIGQNRIFMAALFRHVRFINIDLHIRVLVFTTSRLCESFDDQYIFLMAKCKNNPFVGLNLTMCFNIFFLFRCPSLT